MRPNYFEFSELTYINQILSTFYNEHETVPNLNVVKEIVKKNYDKDMQFALMEEIKQIEETKVKNGDIEYAIPKMHSFSEKQIYMNSLIAASEAVDSGQLDEIKRIYEEAITLSESKDIVKTVSYFEDEDLQSRYDRKLLTGTKISSLFKTFDEKTRGGISKKEMGMLLAPPYRGKSAGLIQLGTNALFTGKNVLHVSFEMSAAKTTNRYDSSITGMTFEQIARDLKGFKKKREQFQKLYKGQLYIEEFPARSMDVKDLQIFIKSLRRLHNFQPDLLVVDYVDEMKRPNNQSNISYAVGEVVANLRGLASSEDLAIWTASQTNRAGLSKVTLDMDDIADSWDKAKVSDIIVALCQTKKEEEAEVMRWVIIKNRDNKRFSKPIYMQTKFEVMRFKEHPTLKGKGDEE